MKENTKKKKQRFVPMATKIAPWAAEVWNEICESLGTDTYHMLQNFIMAMIRAAGQKHELSPNIRLLIDMLDLDVAWQKAINLAAPTGELTISQMILIVEQEDKEGFSAVMIDKPFVEDCLQTENADKIFERLTEVIFRNTYKKLRELGRIMGVESQRQLLEHMLSEQIRDELEREMRNALPEFGTHTDGGREYGFGKKTKIKQHRTPDSVSQDLRFKFDNEADEEMEANYHIEETEGNFANHETDYDPWTEIENGNINFEDDEDN